MNTSDPPDQEIILKGIAAAPGIAVGPAYLYRKEAPEVPMKDISAADVATEVQRLQDATARSRNELQKILSFAQQKLGPENARILEAQVMILDDAILFAAIEQRITTELKNAEFIVADEISRYKTMMLAAADDEYRKERAHDLDDVIHRIIRNIQDQKLHSRLEGESIIVSETLTPADTVIFSRNQVLGYATDYGGTTSHAAILSRSLKIPAVVGLRSATKRLHTGTRVAIDGYSGLFIIAPAEETLQHLQRKAQRFKEFEERLSDLVHLAAETLDHKHIELSANIEFAEEIESARAQGSAGIGLFRTEGSLLRRGTFPSEDEQAEAYRQIAEGMYPHPVLFRTFDVGGDKVMSEPFHEPNPFLGWRGIRIFLDRPDLFLIQLRALLRASVRRNVRVMFPMVSTLQEVRLANQLMQQAMDDLKARDIPFDPAMKVGVMIEVPSAAIMAEQIAAEVDFFSIGTNDLIQYTLAVDRDNSAVATLYQQFNPAVLRLIKSVIDSGHRHNIWVGMCGEMAGDPLAAVLLVGMGLDEFSVLPSMLPEVKKIIRSVRYKDAKRVAEKALAMHTEEEIKEYLSSVLKTIIPELPLDT